MSTNGQCRSISGAGNDSLLDVLFKVSLPHEVLCHIFSYISPWDCFRCLLVCRSWYSQVPLYVHEVWRKIPVGDGITLETAQRFIGPHVREVILRSYYESSVLEHLAWLRDHEVTQIVTLHAGFSKGCQQTIMDDSRWLNVLPVHTLTTLELSVEAPGVDLVAIVVVCPRLAHLGYDISFYNDKDMGRQYHLYCHRTLPPDVTLSIRCLRFSASLINSDRERRLLDTLIQHSPHIQTMSVSGLWPLDLGTVRAMIRPLSQIAHLGLNRVYCDGMKSCCGPVLSLNKHPTQPGLFGLLLHGTLNCSPTTLLSFIGEHQHTLEKLELTMDFNGRDETLVCDALSRLNLNQLKTFYWDGCNTTRLSTALGDLLSKTRQLEKLNFPKLYGTSPYFLWVVGHLANLTSLHLTMDDQEAGGSTATDDDFRRLFEAFVSRSHQHGGLRRVWFKVQPRMIEDDGKATCLLALSQITTLQELTLWAPARLSILDQKKSLMDTFALNLCGTEIATLDLIGFASLPYSTLANLGGIPKLSALAIIMCKWLSVAGLESLVSRANRLRKVTVLQCHADRTGSWEAIQQKLGNDPRTQELDRSIY